MFVDLLIMTLISEVMCINIKTLYFVVRINTALLHILHHECVALRRIWAARRLGKIHEWRFTTNCIPAPP